MGGSVSQLASTLRAATSSSHPKIPPFQKQNGISWIVLIYRLPGGNSFNNEATKKLRMCVCVSGEGIYCNVVRKQREVMFFSVYWKKYMHMYIHNHNLVMSLAILTTPLFFQLSRRTLAA